MRTVLIIIVDQLTVPDAASFARLSTRYGQPASCDIGLAPSLTETAHATLATGIDPDAHGVIGGDWMSAPGYLWSPLVADALADGGARLFVVATKPKVAKLMIPYGQRVPTRHPDRLLSTTTDSRPSGHLLVTRDGAGALISSHVLPGDPFAETIWADEAVIDAAIDIVRNQYDAEIFSGIVVSLADVDVKGHRVPRGNARLTAHLQRIDQRIIDLIDAVAASTDALGATLDVMVTSDHGVRPITTEVFVPPGESVAKVRSTGLPLPWPVGVPFRSMGVQLASGSTRRRASRQQSRCSGSNPGRMWFASLGRWDAPNTRTAARCSPRRTLTSACSRPPGPREGPSSPSMERPFLTT